MVNVSWQTCWQPPADEPVDAWAERTLILTRAVSSKPGPLDLSFTPYLREILRATVDPAVSEITLKTAAQIGKTIACVCTILYYCDQDPWPCLHVMPREEDAMSINVDKYQEVIRSSPDLSRHLSKAAHDATRDTIRINGAMIYFVGANSPAGLASKSICVLILDETDKYPPFAGREADPISLARMRTSTFHFAKIIKTSTPTTEYGYIHREYLAGDQRKYHVPCPHCGKYQVLLMTQIKWPAEHTHGDDVFEAQSAWYECIHCNQRILDRHKLPMLRAGVWCPAVQKVRVDGTLDGPAPSRRHLSYHLPIWYSPWKNWSVIAAEFLQSRADPGKMMNFRNSWEAEIWEQKVEEVKAVHLRARQSSYRMGTVPREALVLTAGVDVQVDHLWYLIRAWGHYGTSWMVRCGQVLWWDELAGVLLRSRYFRVGGPDWVPLRRVFIDAGFRAEEVYAFIRATGDPNFFAVRGEAVPKDLVRLTHHTNKDGSKSPLFMLNTSEFKAGIHRRIGINMEDPGAWHLPEDTPEVYFDHMTAEQRVLVTDRKTGYTSLQWKIMRSGAPNHLFDTEVYALAAAGNIDHEFRYGAPTTTGASPPGPTPEAAEGAPTATQVVVPAPRSIMPKVQKRGLWRKPYKTRYFGG